MSKTALVTGAHGFVGRHLARQMANNGWRVIGLGHGSWGPDEFRAWGVAEWRSTDVTLETLIAYAGEPEVIIHCAGSGSVGFSMTNPYQDFQRTVATMLAVLEYVRLYTPQTRVVYPSSAGVYGVVGKLPIEESDILSPASPYGVHKSHAENLCNSYAKYFNISIVSVRLFSVYGAGLRKQLLWDACQNIVRGKNDFFGTGEEVRDWLHVEDAVSLLITATDHASTACPIVNGGSGVGVTVREVLKELFTCFDRTEVPNFSGAPRSGDPRGYIADISRAREWGWQPKINWENGVREYAAWFKCDAQ